MKIDELTIGEARELSKLFGAGDASCAGGPQERNPYPVGKNVLIRTVTMIHTGRLVEVWPMELVLEDAAWIADTGRFHAALLDPSVLSEIEPFPPGRVLVGRGALVDCCEWLHDLPRTTK